MPTRYKVVLAVVALVLSFVPLYVFDTLNSSKTTNMSQEAVSVEEAAKGERPHVRSSFSRSQRDDAQARLNYELLRLRDPATGRIPDNMREKELEFVKNLPLADQLAQKTSSIQTSDWEFRGPNDVGGRTRALGIDLNFNGTSNQRILAGGISGGMYLSEDNGQSWTLTSSRSELASVTALAQDPNNRNTWYHGTGELQGNSAGGGIGAYIGNGVFKSTDGGRTWSALLSTRQGSPTEFDQFFDYVWGIDVHPANSAVFVAAFGGILRSTDGGDSWAYVLGQVSQNDPFSSITDVVIAGDGDIYATLSRNGSGTSNYGVFKSTDNGDSWQNISPPGLVNDPYRMVTGVGTSDPNTMYLLVQSNQQGATSNDHQLFRYNDTNGNWTNLSAAIPNEQGVEGNASFSTQGGYDQIVTVKPDDPNFVIIGGTNLYRSTDGGNSFSRIGGYESAANYALYPNHHPDQHAFAFYPNNPNTAISGSDGGLSRSDNIAGQPHNWTFINRGYVTTQFYTVAMDPQAGGVTMMGGLQDNGVWATQSPDNPDEWLSLFGGDGAFTAITPGASALYVSSQLGNVWRITPPNNYSNVSPSGMLEFLFIAPFVLDPNDSRVMYLAEAGGVWRNSNLDGIPSGNLEPSSTNWSFLSNSALSGLSTTTVAVATTPANRLYFGGTNFQSSTVLMRVDNAASNGTGVQITPPVTSSGFAPYPSSIAVNPQNGDEIIATFSNYNIQSIWYSSDAGANWSNIDGNLGGENGPSVRTATIVPTATGTMYLVGTSAGVYSTTSLNGGSTTWALEGGSVVGNVVVDMLISRPEDGVVVAGTHGRGVYQATVGSGSSNVAVATLDQNQLELFVNPEETGTTTFTLSNAGTAPLNFNLGAASKRSQASTSYELQPFFSEKRPRANRGIADNGLAPGTASATPPQMNTQTVLPGDFLVYDDGSDFPDDFFGWQDGVTPLQWYTSFVAPVGGYTLEAVYVYMRTENAASNPLDVYITDPDGNVFISGSVTLGASSDGAWYQITFPPIDLIEGQVFDVEFAAEGEIAFPAGFDFNGAVPGRAFYWVSSGFGGFYNNVNSIQGFENAAWLIRAEGTASGSTLNLPPVANIQVSKQNTPVNEPITFDASGSNDPDGNITAYLWTFGDGTQSTDPVVSKSFSEPGNYAVSLTVQDNNGDTGSSTVDIVVRSNNQPPVAVIQVDKIQAAVNESITFDASTSSDADGSIARVSWDFGDGTTSTEPVVVKSYAQAGSYTASLTVTDNQAATGQATVQINILGAPSRLTVTPLVGSIAPGASQVFTVTYDASGQPAGTYTGQVTLSSNGGNFNIPVSISVSPNTNTDVEIPATVLLESVLDQNYPNPFRPETQTTIGFTLEKASQVRLVVFDINGRAVRTLLSGTKPSGEHTIEWDGRDADGRILASGTYLCRMEVYDTSGGLAYHSSRKMVLFK